MEDSNFRKGDAKTAIFGSEKMLQASPVDKIPDGPTTPEIAYQMVKDRDVCPDTAPLELGDIRNYLHGRLCNQTDERGNQHQLH